MKPNLDKHKVNGIKQSLILETVNTLNETLYVDIQDKSKSHTYLELEFLLFKVQL